MVTLHRMTLLLAALAICARSDSSSLQLRNIPGMDRAIPNLKSSKVRYYGKQAPSLGLVRETQVWPLCHQERIGLGQDKLKRLYMPSVVLYFLFYFHQYSRLYVSCSGPRI